MNQEPFLVLTECLYRRSTCPPRKSKTTLSNCPSIHFTEHLRYNKSARVAKSVDKLTDQTKLACIAREAPDLHIRTTAINRLTDQKLLADIAKNDFWASARKTALERLTDQTTVADIAKNIEVSSDYGTKIMNKYAYATEYQNHFIPLRFYAIFAYTFVKSDTKKLFTTSGSTLFAQFFAQGLDRSENCPDFFVVRLGVHVDATDARQARVSR